MYLDSSDFMSGKQYFDYDTKDRLIIHKFDDETRLVLEVINQSVSRILLESTDQPGEALPIDDTKIRVMNGDERLVTHRNCFFIAYHQFAQVYIHNKCVFRLFRKCLQEYEYCQ